MAPATLEAVVILLLAVAPGYIAIVTRARAKTWQGFGSDLDTILRSLAVSLLIQMPMFPVATRFGLYPNFTQLSSAHAAALFLWMLLTVLAVPISGGVMASSAYDACLVPLAKDPLPIRNEEFWTPKPLPFTGGLFIEDASRIREIRIVVP